MIESLYDTFKHWSEKGGVWIYSDPHFNDSDCNLMDENWPTAEEQVKKINSKVGKNDTIIFLGDIGDIECIKKIRGYKVLICGNHDSGATNYKGVFNEVYDGPLMISNKVILSHEPLQINYTTTDSNGNVKSHIWAYNIHGHCHGEKPGDRYVGRFNVCSNVIGWEPVNLGALLKSGVLKEAESIHRIAINNQVERKEFKNARNH